MENINKEANTEERISVEKFYNNYKALSSEELKENMIKSLITKSYVPILEKKILLQKSFERSLVGYEGNRYIDMFLSKINTTICILTMYTKLSFVKGEDAETNIFDDYDILCEHNLLNKIFKYIPETEIQSILTINEQIMQTFYNETKSTEAYVTALIDRFANVFGMAANSGMETLASTINDEEKMKSFMSKLPDPNKYMKILSKIMK